MCIRLSSLCSATSFPVTTTSCGVRLAGGTIFYVDAPYEAPPGFVANPFAVLAGFRRCTQREVEASDCRDLRDRPSERSARFELHNETPSDVWVVHTANTCTPFGIERDDGGAALTIELFETCGAACNLAGDALETWSLSRSGEELSFSWDGREATLTSTIAVCPDAPSLPAGVDAASVDDRCLGGPMVPAAQGRYRASFLVFADPASISCCPPTARS